MRGWLDTEIIFAAIDRVHGVPHEFESTLTRETTFLRLINTEKIVNSCVKFRIIIYIIVSSHWQIFPIANTILHR